MIDLDKENLVTFAQASSEIPGRPHISTVYRWWKRGVRGSRLESVLVGGRRFTSREALERFIQAVSEAPVLTPLGGERRKIQIARAERELDALETTSRREP